MDEAAAEAVGLIVVQALIAAGKNIPKSEQRRLLQVGRAKPTLKWAAACLGDALNLIDEAGTYD